MTLAAYCRSVLFGVFVSGIIAYSSSHYSFAQPETSTRLFEVSEGLAITTLKETARQGDVEFIFSAQAVEGVRTKAIAGNYTPLEAFTLMLEETPLEVVFHGKAGVYAITFTKPITESKQQSNMKKASNSFIRSLASVVTLGILGAGNGLDAQDSDSDIFELSPFTVEASEETGYLATSTLAGTRIKTELGDLSNSITVATKEFMEDLNVNDATSLLPFLGNIETGGTDGTFSGVDTSGNVVLAEEVNQNRENTIRIRGLASADTTRNYMPTSISFDSYNTERVTVNRGPNSVLFGLGSPGGIVDNTVITPALVNRTKIETTVGSWDSYRANFDIERTLVEGKLGLRVAGLSDRQHWRQEYSYENDDRMTVAALYKPFSNANFRVTYEAGEIDARRPRPNAPRDGGLLRWWNASFNKITHSPSEDEYGTTNRDLLRSPGAWFFQPALVFDNDGSPASRMNGAWVNTRRGGSTFRTYTLGLTSPSQWYSSASAAASGLEFGSFYQDEEIIDRSIFDWVNKRLEGPNSWEREDFDVLNLSYDQSWKNSLGSFGIELSYTEESMERAWYSIISGGRGYYITMDVNRTLNWGEPNPNFGRPFVAGFNRRVQTDIDRSVKRGTAFFEVDAKKKTEGFFGGLLGRHTGTLFAQDYGVKRGSLMGRNIVDPDYLLASTGSKNLTSRDAEVRTQFYVGPSLFDRSSAVGANLPGIRNVLRSESATGWYWDNNAVDDGSGDGGWIQRQVLVGDVRDDTAFYNQIFSQSLNRQITDSVAYVHQAYLFRQEWLVGTYGWRKDKVNTYGSTAYQNPETRLWDPRSQKLNKEVSGDAFEATTKSYGVVMKVPGTVPLPEGVDLQFHWGESENFQISAPRIDVFGKLIAPPQGSTEDYGFTLGLMDNKFQIKVNWYETVAGNVSFPYNDFLFETDRRIIRYNTQAERDAAGYQGPPAFYKELTNWRIVDSASTVSGQDVEQDALDFQLTDYQSTASEGLEIDLVYNVTPNWRVMLNVSRQEASTNNIAPTAEQYLEYRLEEWTNLSRPASSLVSDESDEPVNKRVYDTLLNDLNSSIAREGQLVGELREWRANLVTNYRFDENSKLSGWSIGGALRWEDDKAVGYPITLQVIDGQELALPDLSNPYMDDPIERLDVWLGYERMLNEKYQLKVQLNVTNLLSDGEIITSSVQPNGQPRSVIWREGRQFRLRMTLSF